MIIADSMLQLNMLSVGIGQLPRLLHYNVLSINKQDIQLSCFTWYYYKKKERWYI